LSLHRAYSTFTLKDLDDDARVIRGIASTPEPDRLGDILEPLGASFKLPLPLLFQHRAAEPIGHVTDATVTKDGISITAQIAKIGIARIDEAWTLIKSRLVRGLSVGFRPTAEPELMIDGDNVGFRWGKWEWVELSAVTIPANHSAAILTVKSLAALDAPFRAASSAPREHVPPRGDTRIAAVRTVARASVTMDTKNYADEIRNWENTRRTKEDRREAILEAAKKTGELPDDAANTELDEIAEQVKRINAHIGHLKAAEAEQIVSAKAVVVTDPASAARARDPQASIIQVRANLPIGQEFIRVAVCKIKSLVDGGSTSPLAFAKALYPDCPRVIRYLERAAVPAAGTADNAWAGALVPHIDIASEFLEFLRPATIIGKFGLNGVPDLRRVPFNARIVGQTGGGTGYWVGQGAAKPLTKSQYADQTLTWTKVAAISTLTDDLARFSSPSAELLIRQDLTDALVARLDQDFVDPAKAAVASVSPASITNGVAPLVSSGTSADAIRADLYAILAAYTTANQSVGGLVLIMPESLGLGLALMRNPLGQSEFPGLTAKGGNLEGIPVITSQFAVHAGKKMVIAANTRYILLADDGQVSIDASREASLEMSDAPTGNSITGALPTGGMISMFQTNSIALRAERFINWGKSMAGAVVWMDNVAWGSATGS
jgi:HK97 family phage major capsid protein/HK97 family phage prohead protease